MRARLGLPRSAWEQEEASFFQTMAWSVIGRRELRGRSTFLPFMCSRSLGNLIRSVEHLVELLVCFVFTNNKNKLVTTTTGRDFRSQRYGEKM